MNTRLIYILVILAAVASASFFAKAEPITESVTYQGLLLENGVPANGLYDFNFRCFDSLILGTAYGPLLNFVDIPVVDGLVTIELDFGTVGEIFTGEKRYLAISVRAEGGVIYTGLSPRQELHGSPQTGYSTLSAFALESGTTLTDAYNNDPVLILNSDPVSITSLSVPAELHLGSDSTTSSRGSLSIFDALGTLNAEMESDQSTQSGIFRLLDKDAHTFMTLREDSSASGGGYLVIAKQSSGLSEFSNAGIILEGNYLNTAAGALTLRNSTGESLFMTSSFSGNDSVVFPSDAIDSLEIMNEPGVADGIRRLDTSTGSPVPFATVSIDAPASGYVLILGSFVSDFNHVLGSTTHLNYAISESSSSYLDINLKTLFIVPSTGSMAIQIPVALQSIIPVEAGTSTFYMLQEELSTPGRARVQDVSLSAIYFPTRYGAVNQSGGNQERTFTTDSAAQVYTAIDRQREELETMKRRMEVLEQQLLESYNDR